MRLEWNQTSLLSVLLAEPHRDPDQRARPYTTTDFHPLLDRDDNADDGPDWAALVENHRECTGSYARYPEPENHKCCRTKEVTNAFD